MQAAGASCVTGIEALLAHGAAVDRTTTEGYTPLFAALFANARGPTGPASHEAVQLLINAKADVNHRTSAGMTPLICARRFEDVVTLIDGGADVNAKFNTGDTPLLAACKRGHVEIAEYLVRHCADTTCEEYMTAVQKARARSQPLANWMLSVRGFNVVHWLCEQDDAEVLLHTLRDDSVTTAEVCAESWSGLTPLQVAMRQGTDDLFPSGIGIGQIRQPNPEIVKTITAAAQPWSPLRHFVWPRTFRQGVFTILCVAHRLATCANYSYRQGMRKGAAYSGVIARANNFPAQSSSNDDVLAGQRVAVLCREQARVRVALPFDMWCTILSFCSREHWFCTDGI